MQCTGRYKMWKKRKLGQNNPAGRKNMRANDSLVVAEEDYHRVLR